jgi:zinc and cadmium transporter
MILASILVATLAGGVLSVLAAALLSLTWLARWAPRLTSFSVGVLLAAALLDILPEAAAQLPMHEVGATVLAGLFLFFALEKTALWRHDHVHHGHAQPSGLLIVLGDGLHNFVDGVLIAAAFMQDTALGVATATAVIAHEIPQEIGDFMVLLSAGYSRARALALNALSGSAAVAGGVLGYLVLQGMQAAIPYLLAISAASFLYIAIADLVPALQKHRRREDFAIQFALLAGGVGLVALPH